MRTFGNLTVRGKARRLRSLAWHALQSYDFEVTGLRLEGMFTNAMFRLRIANGGYYVLRIGTPGWRTETDLRSEIIWLQALIQEPEIGAPVPIPTRNGEFYVVASDEGVPEPRRCMVMSWLPGIPLAKRLTEENLYKMGLLFALLHEQALKFSVYLKSGEKRGKGVGERGQERNNGIGSLPSGFTSLKMDGIFARGEEDVLFSDAGMHEYSHRSRDVLQQVKERVEQAFLKLYADPTGLRVIHNDLWHGNIKVYRGRLHPLDFEDTIWGYPVQDLAMAIQDLMMDVKREQFEPLQSALRRGYEIRLPWPESYPNQIDTFRAGRMLWVANYVARFERKYLARHIEWLTPQFERFLECGAIRKLE